MTDINSVLSDRGARYGRFTDHANITQTLKQVVYAGLKNKAKPIAADQMEALDMICHKIARIVNGDPNYIDSWVDIAGYAQLVIDRLEDEALS